MASDFGLGSTLHAQQQVTGASQTAGRVLALPVKTWGQVKATKVDVGDLAASSRGLT